MIYVAHNAGDKVSVAYMWLFKFIESQQDRMKLLM